MSCYLSKNSQWILLRLLKIHWIQNCTMILIHRDGEGLKSRNKNNWIDWIELHKPKSFRIKKYSVQDKIKSINSILQTWPFFAILFFLNIYYRKIAHIVFLESTQKIRVKLKDRSAQYKKFNVRPKVNIYKTHMSFL